MKALALLMLTGSVLASNLPPNHGKTRPPKAKTQFNLSYYDIRENLMEEIPKEGVIVEFEISETGKVEINSLILWTNTPPEFKYAGPADIQNFPNQGNGEYSINQSSDLIIEGTSLNIKRDIDLYNLNNYDNLNVYR